MFILGGSFVGDQPETSEMPTHISRIIVDGLYIDERCEQGIPDSYFLVRSKVDLLSIKDVILRRAEGLPAKGSLVRVESGGSVGELRMKDMSVTGLDMLIDAKPDDIKIRKIDN